MKILPICLLLVSAYRLSTAANLRVGIYNSIPDLQGDGFATYKNMIEEFNSNGHTVDAVVDYNDYDPYADDPTFVSYFGSGENSFDLLEIDTARLDIVNELIADVYEVNAPIPSDTLPAAVESVTIGAKVYGYPTLVCGNFLVGLSPGTEAKCPIHEAKNAYGMLYSRIPQCKKSLLESSSYDILYGGKMSDEYGWYLPFLYLDGYVDIYGPDSVMKAINDLKSPDEIVSQTVCDKLNWFVSHCIRNNKNYCTQNFDGSYVESSSNVFNDIENKKTVFFFGFSEKTAIADAYALPYRAISWPFSEAKNYLLQFTDALVVNKEKWLAANEDKRNAIREFIMYFTGLELRHKIGLGEDLNPKRNRYLLQAIEGFYALVPENPIYSDIYEELQRAVAAPSISSDDRMLLQGVLERKCLDHGVA